MTEITPETPIPLLLEQLKGVSAWALIEERLKAVRDRQMQLLIVGRHDMAPTEIQRILGYMRGINDILLEPMKMEAEWKRAVKDAKDRIEANRVRAA